MTRVRSYSLRADPYTNPTIPNGTADIVHYAPPETATAPSSTASMSAGTASNRSCVMVSSIGIKVSGYVLYDVERASSLRYDAPNGENP